MAVDLRMPLVEFFARGGKRCGGQPLGKQPVERGAQLVALPGIAQVELARENAVGGVHAFGAQLLARLRLQLPEDVLGTASAATSASGRSSERM